MPRKQISFKRTYKRKNNIKLKKYRVNLKSDDENEKEKNICKLPTEVVEEIFKYVNVWHFDRIRNTCIRFKEVCDNMILHKFTSLLIRNKKIDNKGYEFISLKILMDAVTPYVTAGYKSLFAESLLQSMKDYYNDIFCPGIPEIRRILLHFFKNITKAINGQGAKTTTLLYLLSMLKLLKNCKISKRISSTSLHSGHWQIIHELGYCHLGILGYSKSINRSVLLSYELLILIIQIVIAAETNEVFRTIWNGESQTVYRLSYDITNRRRRQKATLTFNIFGGSKILKFLQKTVDNNDNNCEQNIPRFEEDCVAKVIVHCKRGVQWGCIDVYELKI